MQCIYCIGQVREIDETLYHNKFYCPVCRRTFIIEKPQPPKEEPNEYMVFNHQGKANAFVDALAPKWKQGTNEGFLRKMRFVLTDNDIKGRLNQLKRMQKLGTRLFFVYPHTARPSFVNDLYSAWEGTTAQFVVNEYHAEVLRSYGYEKPLHGVGWYMCRLRDFQPKERAHNVLFAPIHPRNAPIDRQMNAETFNRLYKHVKTGEIQLTVRYIGDLVDNGLEHVEGVEYTDGKMDQSTCQIDNADVVIGHQTIAWLAVARGTPTVMFAENMPTHFRQTNQSYQDVKSWDKVHDLFRYPIDILEEDDTMALLNRAVRSDCEIADWRRRMIGDAFDPRKFLQLMENYLQCPQPIPVLSSSELMAGG